MTDLTIIYLTANEIPQLFQRKVWSLITNNTDADIIISSKKTMPYSSSRIRNIVSNTPRSHISIYRQGLEAAKEAKTDYIAIAEDDVLYSPAHFNKRPTRPGVFAYNIACWSIYTWSKPPIYSYTGRRNLGQLICEKELFIKAMTERFSKFPDDSQVNNAYWAEPGKYENQLGVPAYPTETFYTDPANVMFTHPKGLSMNTLGYKKRLAPIRAFDIPYWGRAEEIVKMYE